MWLIKSVPVLEQQNITPVDCRARYLPVYGCVDTWLMQGMNNQNVLHVSAYVGGWHGLKKQIKTYEDKREENVRRGGPTVTDMYIDTICTSGRREKLVIAS